MSDDIVKRLQEQCLDLGRRSFDSAEAGLAANVANDAIDEIERLRAENRSLIAALSEPRSHTVKYIGGGGWGGSDGGAGGPAKFSET